MAEQASAHDDATGRWALEALLASGPDVVFQPVIDLTDGRTVGYEALVRGPVGSPLERPQQLFAAAGAWGAVGRLDAACRVAALRSARAAALPDDLTLFVNAEPASLAGDASPAETWATDGLRCVIEVTERALVEDPAGLLRRLRAVREAGWGIALDDVGAEPASLALLPVIEPDVIKLDLRLAHDEASLPNAIVAHAVAAQAERTGAVVLAEGIETERHLERARSMGATVGQGYLLGRPGPLPAVPVTGGRSLPLLPATATEDGPSPYELVAAHLEVRVMRKRLLLQMIRHLEHQALALAPPPLVLATFETADLFTPATRRRYDVLAQRCSFVGALGAGIGPAPTPHVRGAHLDDGDPVRHEWDVVVLGSHFAAAVVARDLGDGGPDRDRRFEVALTFDRDLVTGAARSLMSRVTSW